MGPKLPQELGEASSLPGRLPPSCQDCSPGLACRVAEEGAGGGQPGSEARGGSAARGHLQPDSNSSRPHLGLRQEEGQFREAVPQGRQPQLPLAKSPAGLQGDTQGLGWPLAWGGSRGRRLSAQGNRSGRSMRGLAVPDSWTVRPGVSGRELAWPLSAPPGQTTNSQLCPDQLLPSTWQRRKVTRALPLEGLVSPWGLRQMTRVLWLPLAPLGSQRLRGRVKHLRDWPLGAG